MTKGCSTNSPNLILTESLWDVQSIKVQDSKKIQDLKLQMSTCLISQETLRSFKEFMSFNILKIHIVAGKWLLPIYQRTTNNS